MEKTHNTQEPSKFRPDHGWSWVVLAAGFSSMVIAHLPLMSYSVLYAPVFEEFQSSATQIAWIYGVYVMIWNALIVFLGPLCDALGWRTVAMIGSGLNAASVFCSMYTPSIYFLYLYVSIMSGLGGGTTMGVSFFVLPRYFEKRQGMAMALNSLGACTSLLIGPPMSVYLNDTYGPIWCRFVFGLLMALAVPISYLYRPLENVDSKIKEDVSLLRENGARGDPNRSNKPGLGAMLAQAARRTMFNFKMLNQRRVLFIVCSVPSVFIGYATFQMYIPFAVEERGFTAEIASLTMSVSAIANIIGRIFLAIISDRSWMNRILFFKINLFGLTLSILFFAFSQKLQMLFLFVSWWGFSIGVLMAVYPNTVIDIVGVDAFPAVYGMAALSGGVILMVVGPLIGLVKDYSSYSETYLIVVSGLVSIAIVFWISMPCAISRDAHVAKTKEEKRCETEAINV